MVNAKHMATFLLGAAAGAAFVKYKTMSQDEKEELTDKFKSKAEEFKSQANETAQQAEGYFDELITKSTDAMKEIMKDSESFFTDLFDTNTAQNKEDTTV